MISDIERTRIESCSGGEQKRLVIALELTSIEKPNVLCIDEPTSGLDSNAAEIVSNFLLFFFREFDCFNGQVVKCLKDVSVRHNIAVMASIHQPNSGIVRQFDKLYVLAKEGICVYEGPPHNLDFYMSRAQIPVEYQTPHEDLIKICSTGDGTAQRLAKINITMKWLDTKFRAIHEGRLSSGGIPQKSVGFNLSHFWFLLERTMIYTFSSQWKAMAIQFLLYLSLSIFVPFFFNKHIGEPDGCRSFEVFLNESCFKSEEIMREESLLFQNQRFLFFNIICIQFLMTVGTVLVFTNEVSVFFNEQRNGDKLTLLICSV